MRKDGHPFATQYASCNIMIIFIIPMKSNISQHKHEILGSFIGPTVTFLPEAVL